MIRGRRRQRVGDLAAPAWRASILEGQAYSTDFDLPTYFMPDIPKNLAAEMQSARHRAA